MALVATIDNVVWVPAGSTPGRVGTLDTAPSSADRVYLHWTFSDDATLEVYGSADVTYTRPFPSAATAQGDIRSSASTVKAQIAARSTLPAALLGVNGTVVSIP